jgi:transcriptional regulator with XRE-family HTH domain
MDRRTAIFWDDVRHAFKAFLAAHPRGSRDPWTQASLADALGMHPATLANFLSGTNSQVGGFALAKACALGMEFECDDFRVGRVRTRGPASPLTEQLVLEFSDEFNIARKTDPLTIELRKKPNGSTASDIIRLRVVSD